MSRLNIPLLLLLLAYAVVGALYAVRTPNWQAPDEPAHYNYIAQIVRDGCCPVIEPGDWDKAYIDRLTTSEFEPALLGELQTLQYEDHQPPLYYLLSSVVYRLTNGSVLALRLFSVVIGIGVVAVAYAVARTLLSPPLAVAAAAFVAFVPQHLAMLAAVNNDGLSELVIGLTLLLTIYYLRGSAPLSVYWITGVLMVGAILGAVANGLGGGGVAFILFLVLALVAIVAHRAMMDWLEYGHEIKAETWALGTLVGLGLLTKLNTAFLAGVIPLIIVLRWWFFRRTSDISPLQRQQIRHLLISLALFIIPVLLLAGVWWVRNLNVYGSPDFLGLARHDLVVGDQPRTADQIAGVGAGQYLWASLERTFISFWGQFGWMALPLNGWMLWLVIGFMALVISGWAIRLDTPRAAPEPPQERWRGLAWTLLALTAVSAVLQYIYYNTEFYQMQGRYLFPLLIPLGMWSALGLEGWRKRIFGQGDAARWFAVVPVLVFLPLNLYVVWRIIPLLAPGN